MTKSKILCIYHGDCLDGLAAAWAVRHAIGEDQVEFHAGLYGQDPPDVTERRVLMVDFSYKRAVLTDMAAKADGILVLDHHKTAEADLLGMYQPISFEEWFKRPRGIRNFDSAIPGLEVIFDMARSGAGLTWDYLHPGQPRPLFIDYVEDRDLWTKALPGVDEFTVALRSYAINFKTWDYLFNPEDVKTPSPMTDEDLGYSRVGRLIYEGNILMRSYRLRLNELKGCAYLGHFTGAFGDDINPNCSVVNAPYHYASDLAGEIIDLFPGARFGVCYFEERAGVYKYSLRSRDDKADVSVIAQRYGGGGHRNAAGFTSSKLVHEAW